MSATQIKSISLKHEAIIDFVVTNPLADLAEISTATGYSVPWLSILMNADQFKSELARRRGVIEERIETDITAHLRMAAVEGIKKTTSLIHASGNLNDVASATEKALKSLGYGLEQKKPDQTNTSTFVFNGPVNAQLLQTARNAFGRPLPVIDGELTNVLPAPENRLESAFGESDTSEEPIRGEEVSGEGAAARGISLRE